MREDISRESRYNQILEELCKIFPSRINKSELLEKLGNIITEDRFYTDVKHLSKIGYLVTSFDSEKDFSTRIVEDGITALIHKSPEKRFSYKIKRILNENWQMIVIWSIGIIVLGYIFYRIYTWISKFIPSLSLTQALFGTVVIFIILIVVIRMVWYSLIYYLHVKLANRRTHFLKTSSKV